MSASPHAPAYRCLPSRAGVGLKAEHYASVLQSKPDVGFFEVHAENFMGAGGPPHRYLTAIRETYPLSIHGVGLSIGADAPLDAAHLQRLKALITRYEPAAFSEHLAWSSYGGSFFNDLLPIPYTAQSLRCVVDHINQVQETLGRQMLLENPSTYVAFEESTYAETDFIAAVVQHTGCGLLLDINNVYVSSVNQQWNPFEYIDAYPLSAVREYHLAGHVHEVDGLGRPLLIDTHDRQVAPVVWDLFAHAVSKTGPAPALIEWDAHVPEWSTLKAQADYAETVLHAVASESDTGRSGRRAVGADAADSQQEARTQ